MMRAAKTAACLAVLVGCGDSGRSPNDETPETPEMRPPVVDEPPRLPPDPEVTPLGVETGRDAALFPEAEALPDPFRSRRRMDLDQLDRAIRDVSGGIGRTEVRGSIEVNLFDELAATLGRPDFIEIIDEDLTPSAMFQKFLDDAARHVCRRLMVRESATSDPAGRVFFTHVQPQLPPSSDAAATKNNVRTLLLRFHGRRLDLGAPELEPWMWLLKSAEHVGATPIETWEALCVALMTHPGFFTY